MSESEPSPSTASPAAPAHRRSPGRRAVRRFISDPSSGRNAILLIIVAQMAIVVIGGVVIWLLDRAEFEQLTEAFWYILQTVTTVGYGDVTPTAPAGRAVGGVVMLLGLASLSILTAAITSAFIEARQTDRRASEGPQEDARWRGVEDRLDDVIARLDRLERAAGPEKDVRSE